jgi:hypothetical protein
MQRLIFWNFLQQLLRHLFRVGFAGGIHIRLFDLIQGLRIGYNEMHLRFVVVEFQDGMFVCLILHFILLPVHLLAHCRPLVPLSLLRG